MLTLLTLLLAAQLLAAPQGATPGTVYSPAQAERGKKVVENHCTACHGDDLSGLEGPALVGNSFMVKWEPQDVGALFKDIRDTMPAGAVSSVTDEEKLDAVAYLLQQNGYSEGTVELALNLDALSRIPLSRQTGPVTLRTGSLVRVTGCLTQGKDNAWMLTNASAPRAAATAAAAAASTKPADASPGDQTIQLLNVFPNPSAHTGHRMDVSGLLVRDAAGLRVNVLSLEMLAPSCQQ
jgi:cytochrome c5